jgi:hypothetical protein
MLPRVWCHYCDSYRLFPSEIGREAKVTPIARQFFWREGLWAATTATHVCWKSITASK